MSEPRRLLWRPRRLAAILATENKKPDGVFERTAPGTYRLRKQRARTTAAARAPAEPQEEAVA